MKWEEIPPGLRVEYQLACSCGKTHDFYTQGGEGEYTTEIFYRCECGEYIEINVPIN